MRYLGGKFRIRDNLSKVLQYYKTDYYLEPFCGSCWVGELMPQRVRVFSDANYYLIEMWKEVQKGWIPPSKVSEKGYKLCKEDDRFPAHYKGFVGFAASWGGKFWGGYAGKADGTRNYVMNAHNQVLSRIKNMQEVSFIYSTYSKMFYKLMKANNVWLVYCDPPYEGTTKYYGLPDFDYEMYWENVRRVSKKHIVCTSSYNAPDDFECIWETETKTDISLHSRIERLFAKGLAIDRL